MPVAPRDDPFDLAGASAPLPVSEAPFRREPSGWPALQRQLEAVSGVRITPQTPRLALPWTLVARRGGRSSAALARLLQIMGTPSRWVCVPDGLPTWSGIGAAWTAGPSMVVGCGGGAVLDTAKLVSAIDAYGHVPPEATQLVDGPQKQPGWVIAIPTTCGSGAELTPTVSLWDHGAKTSLDWPGFKPFLAVYDPDYCRDAPLSVTAPAAWDATSHALESLWNRNATRDSRALAMTALVGMIQALPSLGSPHVDWHRLQAAAAAAGAAIGITRSGLAHALSYALTATTGCPHGLAAGLWSVALIDLLLPEVDKAELAAMTARDPVTTIKALWRTSGAAGMSARYLSPAMIRAALQAELPEDRAGRSLRALHELDLQDLESRACALLET